jgi:uncharacterized spore protein YtfJ
MEKINVMVEGPAFLGNITLVPITETACFGEQIGRTVLFGASKTPIAVVVISPTERRAFRMTGEEISLAALTEEIPDVGKVLLRHIGDTEKVL